MSNALTDGNLEKKFETVNNTQDNIQTLSLWLVHHKAHHQRIVGAWMSVMKKSARIKHRLTLIYLANDVVQNSKRKGFTGFVNSFAEVLKEATLLVRDENIRHNVERVFNIWAERLVYSSEFVADLKAILTSSKVPASAPSKLLADFKTEDVIKKLRLVTKLEQDKDKKAVSANLNKLNAKDAEIVQQLKDRTHGQQFKKEFDENARHLEEMMNLLTQEVEERNELILLLEQSEIYYDTQSREAKVVVNAYKNFDSKIKAQQKKLRELRATLPSPLPSPTPDAPSPTSDHELELSLPSENMQVSVSESPDDAPSPVGSPEGLNLSPAVKPKTPVSKNTVEASMPKRVGNPIPILSNVFSHEPSGMTSWLDTFSAKQEAAKSPSLTPEKKKNDSSSLDSRLSNLLQNIPSLPAGLQNTLFANSTSQNNILLNTIGSPIKSTKDRLPETVSNIEVLTSSKEDVSGQNTPLQDEDSSSFFTKLASSNKTHNPKEILKGLTNLIQSATLDKEENQRRDRYTPFTVSEYGQSSGMSSFIKNVIPPVSSQSLEYGSVPPTYYQPPPPLSAPVNTFASLPSTAIPSYQTLSFDGMPSYASHTPANSNLSFIPSLVPSSLQDDYEFPKRPFPNDEYNPETELFNTDMDLENPDGSDDDNIPSPAMEPLSPVQPSSVDRQHRRPQPPARRLSTLITVVTDDSSADDLSSIEAYKSDRDERAYKSDRDERAYKSDRDERAYKSDRDERAYKSDRDERAYKSDRVMAPPEAPVPSWNRPLAPAAENPAPSWNRPLAPASEESAPNRNRPLAPASEESAPNRNRPLETATEKSVPSRNRPLETVAEEPTPSWNRPLETAAEKLAPSINRPLETATEKLAPSINRPLETATEKPTPSRNEPLASASEEPTPSWNKPLPPADKEPERPIANNTSPDVSPAEEVHSPNEEFFIGKQDSNTPSYFTAPSPPVAPPNGESVQQVTKVTKAPQGNPRSRIDTVQFQEKSNGGWFDDWTDDDNIAHNFEDPAPVRHRPRGGFYEHPNHNFRQPNFMPRPIRPNWAPPRRDMFPPRREMLPPVRHDPYGPPPNKQFRFRGRGWGRPQF